jgi:hypothetical protein
MKQNKVYLNTEEHSEEMLKETIKDNTLMEYFQTTLGDFLNE